MTKLPPAERMSSNVFPPSVLSSSTPPSKPRLGFESEASRLKLCRNVNRTQQASKKLRNHPSSRLVASAPRNQMLPKAVVDHGHRLGSNHHLQEKSIHLRVGQSHSKS